MGELVLGFDVRPLGEGAKIQTPKHASRARRGGVPAAGEPEVGSTRRRTRRASAPAGSPSVSTSAAANRRAPAHAPFAVLGL